MHDSRLTKPHITVIDQYGNCMRTDNVAYVGNEKNYNQQNNTSCLSVVTPFIVSNDSVKTETSNFEPTQATSINIREIKDASTNTSKRIAANNYRENSTSQKSENRCVFCIHEGLCKSNSPNSSILSKNQKCSELNGEAVNKLHNTIPNRIENEQLHSTRHGQCTMPTMVHTKENGEDDPSILMNVEETVLKIDNLSEGNTTLLRHSSKSDNTLLKKNEKRVSGEKPPALPSNENVLPPNDLKNRTNCNEIKASTSLR